MRIAFMGDVMLGRIVNEALQYEAPDYPWGDVTAVLRRADLRVCNLECVISDRGQPWTLTPKVFHFRSDAKNVRVLERAQIDSVSIANNHALDYEYQAMFNMREILRERGISFAGAGRNLDEASSPAMSMVGGQRIGVIAFTDNEPCWEAMTQRPGTHYVPIDLEDRRAARLFRTVGEAKAATDLLIVSAHWGPNRGYRPQRDHIPFAKQLINAGADIVFGHSCHIFQGIEIYRGKPIIYSAGDFIDDYAVDEVERNDQSFIFVVETADGGIQRMQLYPIVIRNLQARLARGPELEEIAFKMMVLCKEFGTVAVWRGKKECLEIEVLPTRRVAS
ncbi:MAG TPA: CapA family protein [Candidatus Limnocylindria bacterium]|jgi:poly-gamma-glutamate synthesis protein (capsule biosynthesis protein)|nr:CapA family protein [Candidatus Limnocylindria bacterium]